MKVVFVLVLQDFWAAELWNPETAFLLSSSEPLTGELGKRFGLFAKKASLFYPRFYIKPTSFLL